MLHRLSRRTALKSAAALGVAAAGWSGRGATRAQELTGEITVGFEGGNAPLETAMNEAIAAITAANPGAKFTLQEGGGGYTTQLFLALSTGRGPDCFVLSGLGIAQLGAAGLVAPLDPYLANWAGWTQYPQAIKDALTYNGHVWGLPYAVDTHFLYYRKDVFQQAGIPVPWKPATTADILAAAQQIKANVPNVIPYAIYAGANGGNGTAVRGFVPLLYANCGSFQDENGQWIIDSCAIRATLEYYHQAYQAQQLVPQQAMTAANPTQLMRQAFGNGELAILYEGSWAYGPWFAADPANAENIGFVLHPSDCGGSPFAVGGIGNCWFINARSQNPDLAWALIEATNTVDMHVALNSVDPHIPPRADAAANQAFQAAPFLQAMVGSLDSLVLGPPAPEYRELIGIVQNATGIVAAGEVTPEEAVQRYASELTRVLGEENVVAQSCP